MILNSLLPTGQMILKLILLINCLKLCILHFPHGPRSISSVGKLFKSSMLARTKVLFLLPHYLICPNFNLGEILKIPLDGIMIDNGASKTPSGLSSYLRYCAHTGHKPSIKSSSRSFSGIGNGIISSIALASVRMPLTPDLFLESEVSLIDQDVTLMFGLDKYFR